MKVFQESDYSWLTWHFIHCIIQQATEVAEYTKGLVQYMGHNKATGRHTATYSGSISSLFLTDSLKHSEACESGQHAPTFWRDSPGLKNTSAPLCCSHVALIEKHQGTA